MTAAPAPARRSNPITEFVAGFATLARGFGFWRTRPRVMALGLIPAAIVFAALVVLVVVLALNLDALTTVLTSFAAAWDPVWRGVLRVGVGIALILGLIVLFAVTFTTVTLTVGDWFYGRIHRTVEAELGGFTPGVEPGFWRSTFDALRLVVRALLTGLVVALIGLVPVVGTVLAAVLGVVLSGRIVAAELTTRPFAARGLSRAQRRAAVRGRRSRVTGFGVAVQLCFLIPGGAVAVMPAAVAGATVLAKHVLGEPGPERGT